MPIIFIYRKYMIAILIILITLNVNTVKSQINTNMFELSILGYRNEQMVGIPTIPGPNFPPGSTVPLTDGRGCKELGFRLTYSGSSSCNVTKLVLWQEIEINGGYIWKPAGEENDVELECILFKQGNFYDFLVSFENNSGIFYFGGTIFLRISSESNEEILISTPVPDDLYPHSSLASWPLSSATVFSLSIWVLLFGCIIASLVNKSYRKNRKPLK
jgi:hypothetical protein